MRDPNRLNDFYETLCKLHKTYFPDWRFGQLCSNFFGWIGYKHKSDIFFPEEAEMLELMREYITEVFSDESEPGN